MAALFPIINLAFPTAVMHVKATSATLEGACCPGFVALDNDHYEDHRGICEMIRTFEL